MEEVRGYRLYGTMNQVDILKSMLSLSSLLEERKVFRGEERSVLKHTCLNTRRRMATQGG